MKLMHLTIGIVLAAFMSGCIATESPPEILVGISGTVFLIDESLTAFVVHEVGNELNHWHQLRIGTNQESIFVALNAPPTASHELEVPSGSLKDLWGEPIAIQTSDILRFCSLEPPQVEIRILLSFQPGSSDEHVVGYTDFPQVPHC